MVSEYGLGISRKDTPRFEAAPTVCLSANLDQARACDRPRAEALSSPERDAELRTTRSLNVPYVDLTDKIGTPVVCVPIIGQTLVFRDEHHLTATFSSQLSGVLGAELDEVFQSMR